MRKDDRNLYMICVLCALITIAIILSSILGTTEVSRDTDESVDIETNTGSSREYNMDLYELLYDPYWKLEKEAANVPSEEYSDDADENNAILIERPYIPQVDTVMDGDLLDYIHHKAIEYEISYTLLLAIASVESNLGESKADSYNNNGTYDSGLFQINSKNLVWLSSLAGIDNVNRHNDYHSIDMAIELLTYERNYFREQGFDEESVFYLTVLAYNAGRGNALKWAKEYGFWTSKYVEKVLNRKQEFEEEVSSA